MDQVSNLNINGQLTPGAGVVLGDGKEGKQRGMTYFESLEA